MIVCSHDILGRDGGVGEGGGGVGGGGGGGGDLGELLETSIGVFQILGKNSTDNFSWGGTLNTLNKKKTAFVNVKQRYKIE